MGPFFVGLSVCVVAFGFSSIKRVSIHYMVGIVAFLHGRNRRVFGGQIPDFLRAAHTRPVGHRDEVLASKTYTCIEWKRPLRQLYGNFDFFRYKNWRGIGSVSCLSGREMRH